MHLDAPTAPRPTEARHDVPGLDAVRGFAAFAVLGTHVGFLTGETTAGALGAILARLDFGVAVFFLLSGFLLFRPWVLTWLDEARPVSTRSYAVRRVLRILPLYWLVLTVVLIAVPANHAMSGGTVALNVSLLQIYVPNALPQALTQAWSLATEASFYVALPLIAWLAGRLARPREAAGQVRAGVVLALLVILALAGTAFVAVARSAGSPLPEESGFWLPYTIAWFAIGMALALLQVAATKGALPRLTRPLASLGPYLGTCWTVALLAYLLAATPVAGPRAFEAAIEPWSAVAKLWLYGIAAAFILIPLVMEPRGTTPVRRMLQSRTARWFGDTSYGVFLWHLLILEGVMYVLGLQPFSGGFWIVLLLTYAATLAVSYLTFVVLETPMNRLARRATASPRN